MIHYKVRLLLPLFQTMIAVCLRASNLLRHDSIQSPTWRALDRQLCDGINAPATMIKICLEGISSTWLLGHFRIQLFLDTIVYFGLVWLVWYIVSVEIGGGGRSVVAARTGLTKTLDILAIVFGAAIALISRLICGQVPYSALIAVPYVAWSVAIIVFYGHDLWACFHTGQRTPARDGRY